MMDNNEKMEELKEKMKKLGEKIKDATDTIAIAGMYTKDKLDVALDNAQSDFESALENFRRVAERSQSKASSELIKAQMNIAVAKEKIEESKELHDQEKAKKYIEDQFEYADTCAALAIYAAEEAKIAFLEATEEQKKYDEKYGKKE